METLKIEKENVKMIAHRGLSGFEKENTMAAFIAAGNHSYYGIECDIHKTLDKIYVVIHDDDTSRVSSVTKVIKDSTYEEILQVNLNDVNDNLPKPHLKVPRLIDYLDTCIKYNKICIIEFKNLFNEADINEVLDIIIAKNYLNKCIFISFILDNLIAVRKRDKDIRMQLLVGNYDQNVLDILRKYHLDIDINFNSLTKPIVEELHQHDILINVWTVDNPIVALMLVGWGVDYITTNLLE